MSSIPVKSKWQIFQNILWEIFELKLSLASARRYFQYILLANTSYSAMLNIMESVPPPEPVPSNFGNSIILQYNISIRQWPSSIKFPEFHAIPESDGILGIPSNSVQFRLHPIPGIPYRNYFLPSTSRTLLWSKISLWDK
jgi:hypothetical protein